MTTVKVAWRNVLRGSAEGPPAGNSFSPGFIASAGMRIKTIPLDHGTCVLPAGVSRRPLSRAGTLLHLVSDGARNALAPYLRDDPYSVGLYYAGSLPPVEIELAERIRSLGRAPEAVAREFADVKAEFRTEPWSQSTHLAILLGIRGRTINFNNAALGSKLALVQAHRDLLAGRISAALICSVRDFENPFYLAALAQASKGDATLEETAAACVLVREKSNTGLSADAITGAGSLLAFIEGTNEQ